MVTPDDTKTTNNKARKLYSFAEARRIARGHGFEGKEEYLDYSCPGAYQLPKDPDKVWCEDWKGWDDFLGIPYQDFGHAQTIAKSLGITSQEEWLQVFEQKTMDDDHPAVRFRLPYRPDLYYKIEWKGWEQWLGIGKE